MKKDQVKTDEDSINHERESVVVGSIKKVLLVVPDGAEDMEVAAFTEIPSWTKMLKTTTIEVTLAGWDDKINCFHGLKLAPDMKIDQVNIDEYDCLAIPGGWPGTKFQEQTSGELFQKIIKRAFIQNKLITTMCFGILPLGEAGLLKGIKATSFTSHDLCCSMCQQIKDKLIGYGVDFVDKAIVVDHNIISSIGPAVATEVALIMVERLIGAEQTKTIANMMMYNQIELEMLKWTQPISRNR
ncbi:MAG: protein deglycase [Methyloprofundus sp.]|nr:MAG: protein deglycase [Methyloprofundus sp.]